jgi:hypothetical protein
MFTSVSRIGDKKGEKKMSKLIISGLRSCQRKDTVFAEINKYVAEIGSVEEIIAGGSTGVDTYAHEYAQTMNIKFKEFAPNWQDDLNAAGMVRDTRMAEYGTHLLVLSNGISKESKNLINQAKKNGLQVKTVGSIEEMSQPETKYFAGTPVY